MGRKKLFVYYQPNAKDIGNEYGDCTIRALTKALGCTWIEAFDLTIPICRREHVANLFDAPAKIRKQFLDELGFDYTGVSNKRGTKRPTVWEFAKSHSKGTYICNVAHHEVAVVDGKYFDTWDSGDCSMYGYFERRDS